MFVREGDRGGLGLEIGLVIGVEDDRRGRDGSGQEQDLGKAVREV